MSWLSKRRYAGIDWASDKHDVLVSDDDGEELLAVRQVGLTPTYPGCVASERPTRGVQSVELNDERVRAGLARLDEMSDAELRELVQGEPPIFVEAAEGIIARRRSGDGPG